MDTPSNADRARAKLVFALDGMNAREAADWIDRLTPHVGVFKLGPELLCAGGLDLIARVRANGREAFVDLKLHDRPMVVDRAVHWLRQRGARYVTVHASGGRWMMEAAVVAATACAGEGFPAIQVLAVCVLNAHDDFECGGIYGRSIEGATQDFSWWGAEARVAGFVVPRIELRRTRLNYPDAVLVGLAGYVGDDWTQEPDAGLSPERALRDGADLLVLGPAVRESPTPERTAQRFVDRVAAWMDATRKEGV